MREKINSCLISISILKREKMKLSHLYHVFLFIKWLENKIEIFELKPALSRINRRSWWLSDKKMSNIKD